MAIHNVTLTANQEAILAVVSERTGRTVEVLLANFIEGFVNGLRESAMKTIVEEKFAALPQKDKEAAIAFIETKPVGIGEIGPAEAIGE